MKHVELLNYLRKKIYLVYTKQFLEINDRIENALKNKFITKKEVSNNTKMIVYLYLNLFQNNI